MEMEISEKKRKEQEEYATRGPFASIFGGPEARLFDQALSWATWSKRFPFWQSLQTSLTKQQKKPLKNS